MKPKPNNLRDRLSALAPWAALCSAVVFTTHGAPAQGQYYIGSQMRNPAVARVQDPAIRIVYYRGADGRIYGVASPPAVTNEAAGGPAAPPAPRASRTIAAPAPPRMPLSQTLPAAPSEIVIEDSDFGAERSTAPSRPATELTRSVVDSSARLQAEAALDRFQRLQGVAKDVAAGSPAPGTDVAQVVSAAETQPENLPPPKAY